MSFTSYSVNKFVKHKKKLLVLLASMVVLIGLLFLLASSFEGRVHLSYEPVPATTVSNPADFSGELFFNELGGGDELSSALILALEGAKKSIALAVYSFSSPEIIEILQQKANEGVKVEIVVPLKKEQQHLLAFADTNLNLIEVGDPAGTEYEDAQERKGLMHHKFVIIDEGTSDEVVLFGSSNITEYQFNYDPGFLLKSNDPSLVQAFTSEFNLLKQGITSTSKFHSGRFSPFALDAQYQDGFVELWFGPGYFENSVRTRTLDLINNATTSIQVLGWMINDKEIWSALLARASEGVQVHVLLGDYYLWSKGSPVYPDTVFLLDSMTLASDSFANLILGDDPVARRYIGENFNSFLHHHALIVDGTTLVAGTNNWTYGGFSYNDEAIVVSSVPSLVNSYQAAFDRLWKQYVGLSPLNFSFDEKSSTLHFANIPKSAYEIVVYQEASEPVWQGTSCLRENLDGSNDLVVPRECVSKQTRIFVLDQNGILLGSRYLFDTASL